MTSIKILPPTYLLLAIIAMVLLHFVWPVATVIAVPWNLIGVVPLAVGILMNVIADNVFHRAKTTVRPFEESTVLVTRGVYRLSRNPMYLGFVLMLIGVALLLGTVTPYVVVVVFAVVIDRVFIVVEEQMLAEKFGTAWQAYTAHTRRWL